MAGIMEELSKNVAITKSSITTVILAVILICYVVYRHLRPGNAPPLYGGWIPWIGCAIEFGKTPLYFIEESRKKLGPVFTLQVAGRKLTFLTEPEDYKHFFTSDKVDFQQAVQQPVKNTASISTEEFFKHHTKIHDTVKWKLAQVQLTPICKSLNEKFTEGLNKWGSEGMGDLNSLVRSTMYKGVLDNLFGDGVLPTSPEETFKQLEKHFVKFDGDFEYGSQLPPMFLKDWNRSKWFLMDLFRNIVKTLDTKKSSADETLFQTLVKTIDGPAAPNFAMLMMWAALANAIPITFWALAFLLSHDECLEKAKAELKVLIETKEVQKGCEVEFTQDDLTKLPYIKQCILESIRLRSPGVITRGVKEPISVHGYTIPAGDMLMLSPYWAHRNESFFPDPEQFNPDRWEKCDLEKNLFLEGFVAFGGGRYQCPGRWFALLEIHLFLALILHKLDIKPLDAIPKHSPLHLVGTQQPEGPMNVSFTRRQLVC